jgi:ubiquinone/menaquinone biosynthesis C-methylase UbiE
MLDLDRENPFFRAPIVKSPQNILDIGTGKGSWAMYGTPDIISFAC